MTVDAVTQFGRAFASRPEFVCYVTAAENLGPYFAVDGGVRSIGYNRSALADFQAWLAEPYGSVAELNRQWKSGYAGFAGRPHRPPTWRSSASGPVRTRWARSSRPGANERHIELAKADLSDAQTRRPGKAGNRRP